MQRRLTLSALCALVLASAACGRGHDGTVASVTAAAAGAASTPEQTSPAGMQHGDHHPHHGGVVYMYDDMHYEVVLDPGGHHRVYFTDSAREDLPASVVSSVTLTVERPSAPRESLRGVIDRQGESWLLDGTPVGDKDTSVRVAFVARGSEYWIDVPFIAVTQ
jgi:hypothetical protein